MQEDSFSWNRGIENVFGYSDEEVGKSSKWWFDKIHPEDSIKMSIRLYSFIEQKQKIGRINTVSNVLMILINTF
jgi:PAS domain-containing protein